MKPHKKAKSGAYVINYYDEEGYAALRKVTKVWWLLDLSNEKLRCKSLSILFQAQRTEEKSEHKPLFTVTLNHKVEFTLQCGNMDVSIAILLCL